MRTLFVIRISRIDLLKKLRYNFLALLFSVTLSCFGNLYLWIIIHEIPKAVRKDRIIFFFNFTKN